MPAEAAAGAPAGGVRSGDAALTGRGPEPAGRWPGAVVATVTARRALRSALPWGYVFGLFVATSALGYVAAYPSTASRRGLAASLGTNPGVTALIGTARRIDTVAGFTAWRSLGVLSVVGAVWGLLTATRLLRGEEEAGRWEVLATGQTTRRGATAQALGGLGAGLAVLWAVAAVVTVVVGRLSKVAIGPAGAVYLATALVAGAAVFMAVGALTSQLAATRRRAAAQAAIVLGVAFALRMAADSSSGLSALRWVTPLGWIEELRPLAGPQPWVLGLLAALVAGLAGLAVVLSGRRDLGASTFPDRPTRAARTRLLGSATAFSVRQVAPVVAGWWAGVVAGGILTGSIAESAGRAFEQSSSVRQVLARLGGHGAGARAYLGVVFLMLATVVGLLAAGQVTATRSEEAEGRLDHLVVRPLSRPAWLGGRLAVAAGAVVVAGVLAGLAAWVGASAAGAGVGISPLLQAGLNVVAPALFVVGAGILAFGVWPRAAAAAAYGVVAWSFLVTLLGGVVNLNHWLLDTSLFHHMAAAPAVAPNWRSAAVVAGLGVIGAAAGVAAFDHRDLAGE
jgi:ABC-2 type transport system permease protein